MRDLLQRLTSRKFLTALAVQAAAVAALFRPQQEEALHAAAVKIAALATLLLAALGYGHIEAGVDAAQAGDAGGNGTAAAGTEGERGNPETTRLPRRLG